MSYDRTVQAALAETVSKFRLAEALAMDIPPRRSGPTAEGERSVLTQLEEARQKIIDAGGEARGIGTLQRYRETALWVSNELVGNFGWMPGRSFSAHVEGRASGMSYADFVAMPKATVDTIRQGAGWAGTDGQPTAIAAGWTPGQRAEAIGGVIDPDTADAIVADPAVRGHLLTAMDKLRQRQRQEHPLPEPRHGSGLDLLDLVMKLSEAEADLLHWVQEAGPLALDTPAVRESLTAGAQTSANNWAAILDLAVNRQTPEEALRGWTGDHS